MEQDVKVGSAGDVKVSEGLAGETASGSLAIGPLELDITAKLDNAKVLALLAKSVPGGMLHQGIVLLQQDLFPAAPAAAAPSA